MKKKLVLTLITLAVVISSASVGAIAASNLQSIKAFLNFGIKFKIDNVTWVPKDATGKNLSPITYNNTTYLPLRATGEALGVTVNWDNNTKTVSLVNKDANGSTNGTSQNNAVGMSRKNPAPLNTAVNFSVSDYVNNYKGTASISETIRGAEAWNILYAENEYNDPAPEGYEYLLVKINFKVNSTTQVDNRVSISKYDFDLVSASGVDYEHVAIVVPDPEFDFGLYEGGSGTGWAAYQVKKGDTPLLAFNRSYDGTGGIWYKVQ